MDAADIRPYVRLAHTMRSPLEIRSRIIFDHELVLIVHGCGNFEIAGSIARYQANDLIFIPPFMPHRFVNPDPVQSAHIAVHFDMRRDIPDGASRPSSRLPYAVVIRRHVLPYHSRLAPASCIPAWMDTASEGWQHDDDIGQLQMSSMVSSILCELMRLAFATPPLEIKSSLSGANAAKIAVALDLIRKCYDKPLTTADLAIAACLSISRFNELFKEHTGQSPHRYLRNVRIDAARRLLVSHEYSIKEIAAKCGFDDAFHFSKAFRQIDGLSPTQFREAALAGRPFA